MDAVNDLFSTLLFLQSYRSKCIQVTRKYQFLLLQSFKRNIRQGPSPPDITRILCFCHQETQDGLPKPQRLRGYLCTHTLNIIIEHAKFVPVFLQESEGIVISKIFKLNQRVLAISAKMETRIVSKNYDTGYQNVTTNYFNIRS